MTVKQVSRLTGVSIRTLQYYDKIGLLTPAARTESGYRLYDNTALVKLQQILLFRELEFPLKDIQAILNCPDFDRHKALQQQIQLLQLKQEHIEKLIDLARGINSTGVHTMDFSAFDKTKIDQYSQQAKAQWGHTQAYAEFEKKSLDRAPETEDSLAQGLMAIFTEIGQHRNSTPDDDAVQTLVAKLQAYISQHYYPCTDQILLSLGQMYAAGGPFTENIDAAGGAGTAQFTCKAIETHCDK